MHRRTALRATLAILLTTVASSALAQDKVKLTFLFDNAPSTVAMAEALAAAFEAKHPNIDIETESRPGGGDGDNVLPEFERSPNATALGSWLQAFDHNVFQEIV